MSYKLLVISPRASRAQAMLSMMLLIGGIVVLVGLNLLFLATSFINSAYGFQIAQRAQAVAASGAQDALIRLARDKDFGGVSPGTTYTLAVGSDSTTVTVTQDQPVANKVTIVSTATVSFRQRRVQVVATRDSNTGQITIISWMQT